LTEEILQLVEKELFEGELSDEEMDKTLKYVQRYFIYVMPVNLIYFQANSKKKIQMPGNQADEFPCRSATGPEAWRKNGSE
jgi:hypothetical protein